METVDCELNIILTSNSITGALLNVAGTVWPVMLFSVCPAAVLEVTSLKAENTQSRCSCATSQQSIFKLKLPMNGQNIFSCCRGPVNANQNLRKEIWLYTPKYSKRPPNLSNARRLTSLYLRCISFKLFLNWRIFNHWAVTNITRQLCITRIHSSFLPLVVSLTDLIVKWN